MRHKPRSANDSLTLTDGRAILTAEAPVPLKLHLLLHRKGKPTQFLRLHPPTLDPTLLADGQTVDLRADPEAVKAVLQELAEK